MEEPYSTKLDWAKWYVFWADERMVPISHADSNYNHAKVGTLTFPPPCVTLALKVSYFIKDVFKTWMVSVVPQNEFLSKVPIPQENLITIDNWDVCSATANGYENRLKYVVAMFALFY